jgi:hypothetical protein
LRRLVMMTAIIPFFFILASALAPPAAPAKDVPLGQEFEIRAGEKVRVAGERVWVTFEGVAEDSRCPKGVQCIWAGNAKVMLRLSKGRRHASAITLNTGVDPQQADYRGYEVRLVKLDPYPSEKSQIKSGDYLATLVVSKR